ncbi:hypothetical protein V8F06_008197 [Rhypophila decipiens]
MPSPNRDYLSRLPPELLFLVESHVGEGTLASLAASSKKLNNVFEARLYRRNVRTSEQTCWRRKHPVMIWAAYHNRVDIMTRLVAYGCDTGVVGHLQQPHGHGVGSYWTVDGPGPAQPIHFAAMNGSNEAIAFLVDQGVSIDEPCNARISTFSSDPGLLEFIPQNRQYAKDPRVLSGRCWPGTSLGEVSLTIEATPFLFAVSHGRRSTAESLLAKGTFRGPFIGLRGLKAQSMPIRWMRYNCTSFVAVWLVAAAGQHSLIPAVWHRAHDLEILWDLQHPNQPSFYQSADARKIFHWHLLHLAITASRGNAETVRQLLGMGVPVNSIEGTGNAALSIPIHQGRWKMASTLLELGAGFETGYPTYPAHKISKATFEHGPS